MFHRSLLAAVILAVPALPARAEPPRREAFEVAVDKALNRLSQNQNPDGSWNGGFGGNRDPAVTALCVMAFLSAGHVPGEGPYAGVIEKGVRFVVSQQQQNGVIAGGGFGNSMMYSHGICTLMLAEIIGQWPDRKESSNLRQRLVVAVQYIKEAQCRTPGQQGWRYQPKPHDSDMSVTAWQIMALRAAKNVGCDVPPDVIDRAVEYVKNSRDPQGGYRYTRYGNTTLACTGAAVLSLELTATKEFHGSAESLNSAQFITDMITGEGERRGGFQPRRGNPWAQNHFFYGVYYTSQAMFQIGGKYWKWYREYLHLLLLSPEGHPQQPGGFWTGVSGDDQVAGVNYCTAMAVLALTVEYRFLPIYQRGEEPEEREGK
jgi:prenyltransferase beta subunit